MNKAFEPTLESVRTHQVPQWYHDAKFGIFIHWSVSSIPAFAPVPVDDIIKTSGFKGQFKNNPYAEWYQNSLRIKGSPVQQYHFEKYGSNYSYDNFASQFKDTSKKWDPSAWAKTFKKAGAKYVVPVTKHHDGFLLWPSDRPNPTKKNWHLDHDVVGDLTREVRVNGMRMGYYYSGALDWTFTQAPIADMPSFLTNGPISREYIDYIDAHFRELIDKFKPSVLWNDIGYPPDTNLNELLAYYYNTVPDGVINDRWMQVAKKGRRLMMTWPFRSLINWYAKKMTLKHGIVPPRPPHSDYATPEYATLQEISKRKWECVRGIGHSFAYNQNETDTDYLKAAELVEMLIDIVSKNGNLLLNIGPMADGTIPDVQLEVIAGIGRWLETNGEAIYGTQPWVKAEGKTACNMDIRFTRKNDSVFAALLKPSKRKEIVIKNLQAHQKAEISVLGNPEILSWNQQGTDLAIALPESLPPSPAHVLQITPQPECQ